VRCGSCRRGFSMQFARLAGFQPFCPCAAASLPSTARATSGPGQYQPSVYIHLAFRTQTSPHCRLFCCCMHVQPRLLQFGEKVPSSVSSSSLHAITKTSHALFSHMHRPTFQVSLNSLLWFVLQSPRSLVSRARRCAESCSIRKQNKPSFCTRIDGSAVMC
jgi:hypothetical protein